MNLNDGIVIGKNIGKDEELVLNIRNCKDLERELIE